MELHISLEGRRKLTAQVYRQIRDGVMEGRLRAGEALPSSRELARRLAVSRNTVVLAYERLRAEGFVTARVGAGTFVSEGVRPRPPRGSTDSPLRPRALWGDIPEGPNMSSIAPEFDFRPGIPDARHFPFAAWRARVSRQLRPGAVGTGRVLYVGSFSKVMLPTLRLGFVVAPAPLHAALRKAKHLADWHTAVPVQAAAAEFIDDGLLARHIRRMRRIYAERHERITAGLERDLGERLTPLPSAGGLHLAALFRGDARPGEGAGNSAVDPAVDRAIADHARADGVAILPLAYHSVDTPPRPGFIFGYRAIPTDRIEEGLTRLRGFL